MISYKKIFHGFIWLLFFSFLVLYFAQAGGYYEDLNNKKDYSAVVATGAIIIIAGLAVVAIISRKQNQ